MEKMRPLVFLLFTLWAFAADPWTTSEVLQAPDLAARLKKGENPSIVYVGPTFLYRGQHIAGAIYGGMGAKPEGIQSLLAAVKNLPKDKVLIIYCGCCPWNVCPNMRPAFQALKTAGFRNVKALYLPVRLADDWAAKGYPVASGDRP
jgi:rhodanese-related sulfurtransferase